MSNYQVGAFDALEWAWYMLRDFGDKPDGVNKARKAIQETLANIGKGKKVNFRTRKLE